MVADLRKNCFTTPSGNNNAMSSPKVDPIMAPKKRTKIRIPTGLLRNG